MAERAWTMHCCLRSSCNGGNHVAQGFMHCCGFNSMGMMLGGGIGREVATWITEGSPSLERHISTSWQLLSRPCRHLSVCASFFLAELLNCFNSFLLGAAASFCICIPKEEWHRQTEQRRRKPHMCMIDFLHIPGGVWVFVLESLRLLALP